MTLSGRENSYQQALGRIKNKVAFAGGNRLTIKTADTDNLVTVIEGDGYRCPLEENGNIKDMSVN